MSSSQADCGRVSARHLAVGSRRSIRRSAAVVALVVWAVVLPGCGTKLEQLPVAYLSPSPTASAFPMRVTHDTQYGFRMAYPKGWLRSTWTKPSSDSTDTNARLYALSFADPKGARPKGTYVDAEQVAVYQLSKEVTSNQITQITAFKIINGWILFGLPGMDMKTPEPKKVDIHGDTGWLVQYAYEVEDETIWAKSILVCKGRYAYWVTGQASVQTWHGVYPTIATALHYFRVD